MYGKHALRGGTAIIALLAANLPALAQDLPKLVIALGGDGLHYAALHVAEANGYFEEAGVDAEWPDVSSGTKQVAAVMGGSADLVPTGLIQVLKAVNNGSNLVAVGTHFDIFPSTLVVSNAVIERTGIEADMPIDEKVKLLAEGGISVGISSPGGGSDMMIRSTLLTRGFNPDEVMSLQPLGDGNAMFAALERGAVDGFVWQSPVVDLAVQRGLGAIMINPFTGEVPEMVGVPYTIMATSRSTLEQKPEVIEAGLEAHLRGMQFIHEYPDEARVILREHFSTMDEEAFNLGFDIYLAGIPQTNILTEEQVQKTIDWMNLTATDPITGEPTLFIDMSAAEAAETKVGAR